MSKAEIFRVALGLEAERDKLKAQRDGLLVAARVVPEPEDEGICPNCGRMELNLVGEAYQWQHKESCWWAKLRAAIAEAEKP